uniref:Cadherin-like protein 26 n=1 Tax=Kryptolebias marmoratus TaxID=37003 RepID=A0A3Q3BFS5_KRYMA
MKLHRPQECLLLIRFSCLFVFQVHFLSSSTCSELLSRQKRVWIIDSFEIEEENPGPFPYFLGKVRKSFKEGCKLRDMTIDTRLGVEIKIRDINDNPPRFNRDLFEITVDEELTQGKSKKQIDSPNSTFHYNIKSVFPKSPDTEFFVNENGLISFKGCLDYDVANEITVVVEAIDHGDKVQLSSSTTVLIHIEDSNNHLPIITGQTVSRYEFGTSPLKIHVTDKDSPHSKAWKAKYTIHNDDERNFKIETDPETNDGILTVVKPINYEEKTTRELMISVENEAPYFFCKVKQKTPVSTNVVIEVEDVNDPPEFEVTVKKANVFVFVYRYKIGEDPAGWMKIDPNTGNITTIQTCDRESPHVVDSVYTLLLHAVDKGDPPMTGTATLHIHLVDENDNLPRPEVEFVDVCMSDGPTTTNISASDADADPYGGPFRFELLGNVEGKWKLDPSYGRNSFTAGLVKELNVQAGFHTLELKISDLQGQYGVYSLNVTVCTCSVTRNCRSRSSPTTAGWGAAGIAFLSLVLLLGKEWRHRSFSVRAHQLNVLLQLQLHIFQQHYCLLPDQLSMKTPAGLKRNILSHFMSMIQSPILKFTFGEEHSERKKKKKKNSHSSTTNLCKCSLFWGSASTASKSSTSQEATRHSECFNV